MYVCMYVWPTLHGGMCTCYVDFSISPVTYAASNPTNLYGSTIMAVICLALLPCVAYPHTTATGAYFFTLSQV